MLDEASASSVLGAFVQKAGHLGKYQNGSGQVFGILNSMKDEFSADLKELQEKIETETIKDYVIYPRRRSRLRLLRIM